MSDYLLKHGSRQTPQSEPMRGDQVENSAGGYTWAVDEWTRLRRFLILGSEGGSYYATERELTKENIDGLLACIEKDGVRTVNEIVAISDSGRAPKNDPALFALAVCISRGNKETRRTAAEVLPQVARIGTHLYHFVAYAETQRGWGRLMRWAVSNWYAQKPEQLQLQAIKYRQRDGWSHRDLLRLAHPKNDVNAPIYDWITHGGEVTDLPLIEAFERAQKAETPAETAALVREFQLPREALKTEHLQDPGVWEAMLFEGGKYGMPITALIRNLANMTRVGLFESKEARDKAAEMITAEKLLKHARVHPLTMLVALRTYAAGVGFRGSNSWTPKPQLVDALDEGFYLAFENVEPTGKSHLLAIDVSGSMGVNSVCGSPLTPREASVAMALVTLHAEEEVECMGFSTTFMPLPLSRRQRLDDAVRSVSHLPFRGTDCALPMLYAIEQSKSFGAFVTYTDSETWFGQIHPAQALAQYRNLSGIQARSVVVGMTSNGFTIADPQDPGSMDVVGMDTATPNLISQFVAGQI